MHFPNTRPRRLRANPQIRNLVAETSLEPRHLICPIFIKEGLKAKSAIPSMPGVFQHSIASAVIFAKELEALGVSGVILFGIPRKKDPLATQAYASDGIVQQAATAIKSKTKSLLVITDVCLCEYTSHGHCGILDQKTGIVRNDPTLELLGKTALSHARAGADIVAPSDMMDGRVGIIRSSLDAGGFHQLPIMSYAVKYASALYGPFRDAAENTPSSGDRRSYQMDARNRKEALREIALDLHEGADFLIVKPATLYLDIINQVSQNASVPVIAYHVSGEYSMIHAANKNGWINGAAVMLEAHLAMRRAGAQAIISYATPELAKSC